MFHHAVSVLKKTHITARVKCGYKYSPRKQDLPNKTICLGGNNNRETLPFPQSPTQVSAALERPFDTENGNCQTHQRRKKSKETAGTLFIGVKTVYKYRPNIQAKVSLNNSAELHQAKCLILIEMLEKDRSEQPVLHSLPVETGAEGETEFYNHRLLLKSL